MDDGEEGEADTGCDEALEHLPNLWVLCWCSQMVHELVWLHEVTNTRLLSLQVLEDGR